MLHEEGSLSCSDDQTHLSAELKIATYFGVAAGLAGSRAWTCAKHGSWKGAGHDESVR